MTCNHTLRMQSHTFPPFDVIVLHHIVHNIRYPCRCDAHLLHSSTSKSLPQLSLALIPWYISPQLFSSSFTFLLVWRPAQNRKNGLALVTTTATENHVSSQSQFIKGTLPTPMRKTALVSRHPRHCLSMQ